MTGTTKKKTGKRTKKKRRKKGTKTKRRKKSLFGPFPTVTAGDGLVVLRLYIEAPLAAAVLIFSGIETAGAALGVEVVNFHRREPADAS
jgi:hypothetical protein